jgi:hypothetical protein
MTLEFPLCAHSGCRLSGGAKRGNPGVSAALTTERLRENENSD